MKILYLLTAAIIFVGGGMALESLQIHTAYIALWGAIMGLLIGMSIPD